MLEKKFGTTGATLNTERFKTLHGHDSMEEEGDNVLIQDAGMTRATLGTFPKKMFKSFIAT